ncbi:Methyltransferase type 12 [Allomeiothermus silvanus DSM 9946]|uniref:Methyltransferase type 12 n=1 Tax=Allomeiothermus silvanus (strain ATCC 700542 / DSM 9946 / NBRC 106475 / NCIMB 13440 / VI-R2) TaxID=526227 RepID=D7BG71_ALLS1|nr:class I SAM-dependent methyltransferase [Allomeiothermus silvanus]ADH61992.1 Methyltransferase type 12 [Allomeiothermus silvanus DSM 9946]
MRQDYSFKDYRAEAEAVHARIQQAHPGAKNLLEVACGTGKHLEHLKAHYEAVGLDLDAKQLEEARRRNPEVVFYQGDMRTFDLGRTFDAITCLFSAIGHAGSVEGLEAAVYTMARHLNPGGVLLVEPWLSPQVWQNNRMRCLSTSPTSRWPV